MSRHSFHYVCEQEIRWLRRRLRIAAAFAAIEGAALMIAVGLLLRASS